LMKDVCSVVASKCVDPQTGLPLTVQLVERALRSCGFSVRWGESAKKQSLRAMELLKREMPAEIMRAQMLLRVSFDARHEPQVRCFLEGVCGATIESKHEMGGVSEDDCKKDVITNSEKVSEDDHKKDVITNSDCAKDSPTNSDDGVTQNKNIDVEDSGRVEASTGSVEFRFRCDPCNYRQLDQLMVQLNPPGVLQLITSQAPAKVGGDKNAQNGSDFGKRDVGKSDVGKSDVHKRETSKDDDGKRLGNSTGVSEEKNSSAVGGLKCSTCKVAVGDTVMYRAHCRTAWHAFNVKRLVKQLHAVSEEEYEDLSLDLRMGFLAVDS